MRADNNGLITQNNQKQFGLLLTSVLLLVAVLLFSFIQLTNKQPPTGKATFSSATCKP
jgi:hypothetical protein